MMQMTLLQMNNIYVLEYCRVLVAFVFAVSFWSFFLAASEDFKLWSTEEWLWLG